MNPDGVRCQGDGVDQEFVIVDAEVIDQMRSTIAQSDLAAVRAGIEDMEAGRMQPAAEAHRAGREELKSKFS